MIASGVCKGARDICDGLLFWRCVGAEPAGGRAVPLLRSAAVAFKILGLLAFPPP
jgi:hypothetical protein